MGMLSEFKTFISRGNVLDLAVGVIIGAAFGKIVTSLTESVIMPVVGFVFGGFDFSDYFIRLGAMPASYRGSPNSYAQLKAAGVPLIGYGDFLTQVVNFLILAWIIFLIVKAANRIAPITSAPPVGPTQVDLLAGILEELKARPVLAPALAPLPPSI